MTAHHNRPSAFTQHQQPSPFTPKLRARAGQYALAYVTAKTHGLEEEAGRMAEAIGADNLPAVDAGAPLLLPPTPILREDNWPLLTVSKGFFENLAQQGALFVQPALAEFACCCAAVMYAVSLDLISTVRAWCVGHACGGIRASQVLVARAQASVCSVSACHTAISGVGDTS